MAASDNGRDNGIYTYDSFSGKAKKKDTHFLWWCAGAHQQLLNEYPSEQTKYAGLGGVLLATFALASLAAGYAVYSVFNNWTWAVVFALVWGLVIFNFDRFLVSTMRKYGVSTRKQVWMAVPRIVLALLIGFTIARPLELKLFQKEIDVKVAENRHKKILLNDSLLRAENSTLLSSAEQERSRLIARKLSLEDTLHRLQQAYVQEADGTGGSMQRGIEKLTRLKQEAYVSAWQQSAPELQKLDQQIAYQDSLLNNAKAGTEARRRQYETSLAASTGFLERNKALSDLTEQESSVFWCVLLISLLIILIETGPILSKLIMSAGPYDLALAKTELLQMAASENELRRDKSLLFDKLENLYKKKKELSDEMIEKLAGLQKKHIDEELGRWERGERNGAIPKASLDDMMKRIKDQYDYKEEHVL